jgi:hypothetical protein
MDKHRKEIDKREIFFPVVLRPIYIKSDARDKLFPNMERLPKHHAVVDVEHNRVLSVVSDKYKLLTNEDAYKLSETIMKQVFNVIRFEDMVCFNYVMPKTRSYCHIDFIHNGSSFQAWETDSWTAFLRITNSYNRTRKLRFEIGFCRWICMNGLIFDSKSVELSYVHSSLEIKKIEQFAEKLGDIRNLEKEFLESIHSLKRYYIPEPMMLPLACRVFQISIDEKGTIEGKRLENFQKLRQSIESLTRKYFSEMGPHGYAALNVFTDFASRPSGLVAPVNRINTFQSRCGNWMQEFIKAVQSPNFSLDSYLSKEIQTANILRDLKELNKVEKYYGQIFK